MKDAPFKPKVLAVLITLGAVSFLSALVWSAVGNEPVLGGPVGKGSDTYSGGALGHSALVALLRELDLRVVVSRFGSGARAGDDGLLVLSEPDPDRPWSTAVEGAQRVLIVLPKWRPEFDGGTDGSVRSVSLVPLDTVRAGLYQLGINAAVVRPPAVRWGFTPAARVPNPQLLAESRDLQAVLSGPGGMLLGRHHDDDGRTIFVLSDPDILANHGLDDGRNAEVAMMIFDRARDGAKTIVFDETLHGFGREPSFWGALFRFPLALVLAQLVLACAVLLWAAAGRFGAPVPAERGLGAGKEFLIGNIASLLRHGGHSASVLRRYYQVAAIDVHRRLHGTGRAGSKSAREWLDNYGAARRVGDRLTDLRALTEDVVRAKRTPPAVQLEVAQRIHRWREEMIHGPRRHS